MELILEFKVDSLILAVPEGNPIEISSYTISNDTLKMVKLDGKSPCAEKISATYRITLKDKLLYISPISDDCFIRATAWPAEGMQRID